MSRCPKRGGSLLLSDEEFEDGWSVVVAVGVAPVTAAMFPIATMTIPVSTTVMTRSVRSCRRSSRLSRSLPGETRIGPPIETDLREVLNGSAIGALGNFPPGHVVSIKGTCTGLSSLLSRPDSIETIA